MCNDKKSSKQKNIFLLCFITWITVVIIVIETPRVLDGDVTVEAIVPYWMVVIFLLDILHWFKVVSTITPLSLIISISFIAYFPDRGIWFIGPLLHFLVSALAQKITSTFWGKVYTLSFTTAFIIMIVFYTHTGIASGLAILVFAFAINHCMVDHVPQKRELTNLKLRYPSFRQ